MLAFLVLTTTFRSSESVFAASAGDTLTMSKTTTHDPRRSHRLARMEPPSEAPVTTGNVSHTALSRSRKFMGPDLRHKTIVSILRMVMAALVLVGTTLSAMGTPGPQPLREIRMHPNWPEAKISDSGSISSIVTAFCQAVSAPAGGKIDRARLRSLFAPDGRISIVIPPGPTHAADIVFLSPDSYAPLADEATKKVGFSDTVIASHVETFGAMAHVYTAYSSRHALGDKLPFTRGMKSFELLKSGDRWYILSVTYDRERTGVTIPDKYLH